MYIANLIADHVRLAVKDLYGLDLTDVFVEHPQSATWGDYSTNVAMVNAKSLSKKPRDLANELADKLLNIIPQEVISNIEVAGPGFINFYLSKGYYLSVLKDIFRYGDDYGKVDLGKGVKVALEHSNVNPNKAAHVGHLRNAVIGQFIERAYEFLGYDVNVQYYANDLGVQVSTSLLGVEKLKNKVHERNYDKFDHYMWDVYAKISQLLENDAGLKAELQKLMLNLDNRDPKVSKKQKDLSYKVLKDNIASFSALNIDYDLIVYESSIKDMSMWEIAFNKLKMNSNVYKATQGMSAGCWLVRMSNGSSTAKNNSSLINKEKDKIIVRSNGVPTYTGKDIAYHMWKFGLLKVDFKYKMVNQNTQNKPLYETTTVGETKSGFTNNDIVIDVIDVRQTYAIDAVRKSLEYLGYTSQSNNLVHVNYGHVYISNNTAQQLGYKIDKENKYIAMSGRKGLGIKIDDFVDMVDSKLKDVHGNFPNLKEIRNSAIKFDMLRYDTFQDIVFDIDKSLNIKGFTGPYIQYTHARANSLLEKSGIVFTEEIVDQIMKNLQNFEPSILELQLMQVLYRFPEVVQASAKKYAPNILCVYLYDVCQKFNTFYNDSPVLKASDSMVKNFRLLLALSTKQIIKSGLYLLGINAVDRM